MPFKNPHPLYNVWMGIKRRCNNPNAPFYSAYGGRGISVCDRWRSFRAFVEDMGDRPAGHSLDRIDNDGDYTPENCRWADAKTQQRNKRLRVFVEIAGVKYRAIELAEMAGVKTDTIVKRAAAGLPYDLVVSPDRLRDTSGLGLGPYTIRDRKALVTHCKRGHEFTEKNTQISPEGWRRCRECHNAKMRRRNADKRNAGA